MSIIKKNAEYKKHILLLLVPICLFLSNFSIITLMGKKLRPLEIIVPLVVVIFLMKIGSMKFNPLYIVMTILPLFGLFNVIDLKSFLESYAFYFLEIFVLYAILENSHKIPDGIKYRTIELTLKLFILCTIYGLVQFALANFLNNMSLYNSFGWFQYHKHYDNQLQGIIRATSIFYEPSVFGWMSVFVFCLNEYFFVKKFNTIVRICTFVAVAISFSSSAILGMLLVFVLNIFVQKNRQNGFVYIVLLLITILIGSFMRIEWNSLFRLNTISSLGSSGYNRVTYPFIAMLQSLKIYPIFGRGLGQISVFDVSIGNSGQIYNAIFGIIVSFGISSLIVYSQMLKVFLKWLKLDFSSIIFIALILFLLFSNGSFLTLEFPVIGIICNYAVELKIKYLICDIE